MKTTIYIALMCASIMGCTTIQLARVPIQKGIDASVSRTIDKNYDDVWSKLVEVFAERNLPINVFSKESGLITTAKYKVKACFDSDPIDTTAHIFVNKSEFNNQPNNIWLNAYCTNTASFNVRIVKIENKTKVFVNLVDVYCAGATYNYFGQVIADHYQALSTGKFENELLDTLEGK